MPPLQNVCVVTTFYTLVGILSILFSGVALDIITCRPRKRWMRRSPFCGFHVFREPCFYANESLCHKTKSIKQRVAHSHGDLLIHHLRWSPERRLLLAKVATRGKPRVVLRWRRLSVKLQFMGRYEKGRNRGDSCPLFYAWV